MRRARSGLDVSPAARGRNNVYLAGILSATAIALFVFDVCAFWFGGSGLAYPSGVTPWGAMLIVVALSCGVAVATADRLTSRSRHGIGFAAGFYATCVVVASLLTLPASPTETVTFRRQATPTEVRALLPRTIGWPNLVTGGVSASAPGQSLRLTVQYHRVAKQYREGLDNRLRRSGLVASMTAAAG